MQGRDAFADDCLHRQSHLISKDFMAVTCLSYLPTH